MNNKLIMPTWTTGAFPAFTGLYYSGYIVSSRVVLSGLPIFYHKRNYAFNVIKLSVKRFRAIFCKNLLGASANNNASRDDQDETRVLRAHTVLHHETQAPPRYTPAGGGMLFWKQFRNSY